MEIVAIALEFPFKLRFDFNQSLSEKSLEEMLEHLGTELEKIEYFEDPLPLDLPKWEIWQKRVPLAMDLGLENIDPGFWEDLPAQVLVLKPARQDMRSVCEYFQNVRTGKKKFVITHNLDHPVGQCTAYSWALELNKKYSTQLLPIGCLSLNDFHDSDFSRAIQFQGPWITKNPGMGVGFDHLLEQQTWIEL